jgi:hypothetical protein
MFKSLTFWTLVAGLLAFVAKFFIPSFPLSTDQLLAIIVMLLGLVNVVPQARAISGFTFLDLVRSKPFWVLVSGLAYFIVRSYVPTFPLNEENILALIVFALGLLNIKPELRARSNK